MPNLKKEVVDKHIARVAASIYKAVNERTELLPYMKKTLMNSISHNIGTLTDEQVNHLVDEAINRGFMDAQTEEEGSIRGH